MSLDCPRCADTELKLVRESRTGLELGVCPKCKGMWFDGGVLPRLLNVPAAGFQPPAQSLHVHRRCPVCHQRMCGFRFPNTLSEIEVCEKCLGVWLDEGEYDMIRGALRR
jgi:Zn-finger nucleic acid-binding protein